MNSGSAASVHDALALQVVVARTRSDRHACRQRHRNQADETKCDRDPDAAGEHDDHEAEQDDRELDHAEIGKHQPPPPCEMRSMNSSGVSSGLPCS